MLAKKAKRIVFVVCLYALACVTVKQIFFTFYRDYNPVQSAALFVLINSSDLLLIFIRMSTSEHKTSEHSLQHTNATTPYFFPLDRCRAWLSRLPLDCITAHALPFVLALQLYSSLFFC